jgi:hypothetical protein
MSEYVLQVGKKGFDRRKLEISEFDGESYYTFPRQAQVFGYKQ